MNTDALFNLTDAGTRNFSPYTGLYGANGHQFCGCCGGRMCYTEEEFNSTKTMADSIDFVKEVFNKGVLVALNLDPEKIKEIPGSRVDVVKVKDDTIFIRLLGVQ